MRTENSSSPTILGCALGIHGKGIWLDVTIGSYLLSGASVISQISFPPPMMSEQKLNVKRLTLQFSLQHQI